MRKRSLPLARVYGLLESGPVVLLTTARRGRPNVMAMSWHTMLEFEPPLVGCVVSNRNHSFATLRATRECVLAIPTAELAPKVVRCGNASGRDVDKFARFGLTPVAASHVGAPLVAECFANLECKVVDTRMVNRYNFFVLEVVHAWVEPGRAEPRTMHHRGRGRFMIAGQTIALPSRMK
ncbi:MAG: flavin reductase family protein [Betaproteobacteria bacterium]|nr:flavin reductase family protein [Betaproteobacteria bacterium]